MERRLVIGPHGVRQVDDVLELEVHGPVTREHAVLLHDLMAQVLSEKGCCFVISDLADATTVNADARRYMADWNRTHRASGMASYNLGFATRVFATLLTKAIHLLGAEDTPLVFFRDEAEARAWIAARRVSTSAS